MLELTQLAGFGIGGVVPLSFTLDGTAQDNVIGQTVYTVVAAIPQGSLIVVIAANNTGATGSQLTSVTDSKGNTYSVDQAEDAGGSGLAAVGIASAQAATALAPGDTITTTLSNGRTGHGMIVGYVLGNATSSAKDKSNSNNSASGNSPTTTTAATTQANEIVFGAVMESSTGAVTEAAGYSNIASLSFAGATRKVNAAYKIVAATGAQTYNPGLTGSPAYAVLCCAYKGAP